MAKDLLPLVLAIEITGTTPLLMHNERLADPADEFAKAMKVINGKGKKKTPEDNEEVAHLEFKGGLYLGSDGVPMMPFRNVRKCLINAARFRRLGKDVERALVPQTPECLLAYEGPTTAEGLWGDARFQHRAMVRVSGRVPRMRPKFSPWVVVAPCALLSDILSREDLEDIATTAGQIEGLGDGRAIGFGRFSAVVKAA